MLKLIGIGCVMTASCAVGFHLAGNVRRQSAQLEGLISGLEALRGELLYRQLPLPELLECLSENENPVVGAFFHSWAEQLQNPCGVHFAMQAALRRTPGLCISERTRSALSSLAMSLGRLDAEGSARVICLAQKRLSAELEGLQRASAGRCRSYCVIGVCTALAMAVILL